VLRTGTSVCAGAALWRPNQPKNIRRSALTAQLRDSCARSPCVTADTVRDWLAVDGAMPCGWPQFYWSDREWPAGAGKLVGCGCRAHRMPTERQRMKVLTGTVRRRGQPVHSFRKSHWSLAMEAREDEMPLHASSQFLVESGRRSGSASLRGRQ
jgi:hypothetical protein